MTTPVSVKNFNLQALSRPKASAGEMRLQEPQGLRRNLRKTALSKRDHRVSHPARRGSALCRVLLGGVIFAMSLSVLPRKATGYEADRVPPESSADSNDAYPTTDEDECGSSRLLVDFDWGASEIKASGVTAFAKRLADAANVEGGYVHIQGLATSDEEPDAPGRLARDRAAFLADRLVSAGFPRSNILLEEKVEGPEYSSLKDRSSHAGASVYIPQLVKSCERKHLAAKVQWVKRHCILSPGPRELCVSAVDDVISLLSR